MFGIGWSELILIALVLLIVVGPRQLPSLLKRAGMIVTELKRAGRELQHQVGEEVRELERTVGTVQTPNEMLRDAAREMAYDTYDPYADVTDVEDEPSAEDADFETRSAEPSAPEKERESKPVDTDSPVDESRKDKASPP